MVEALTTAAASLAPIATFCWQDGILPCNDGNRYTSHRPQPYPFHRRFCGWNTRVLQVCSLVSLPVLGVLMGSWERALLLLSLPGAWFIATHPTTTDAVCMLLAWVASLVIHTHPVLAVVLSCVGGFIHERTPVFAALYCWSPWPLVGMLCAGWWKKPANGDPDKLVGQGFIGSIKAHRPYVDLLDWRVAIYSLRALWFTPLICGCSWRAVATVAVSFGSRVVGTDSCRYMFWAAPVLAAETPAEVPLWMLAAHVLTFRRAI